MGSLKSKQNCELREKQAKVPSETGVYIGERTKKRIKDKLTWWSGPRNARVANPLNISYSKSFPAVNTMAMWSSLLLREEEDDDGCDGMRKDN